MTEMQQARFSFELRRAGAIFAFASLTFLILYAAPTYAEAFFSRYFRAPTVCCIIGDTAAYLVLFALGFRRLGAAVYLLSKAIEIFLLKGQMISAGSLLWLTDLLPTIVCTSVLSWMVFFSREAPFPELN
jgi:hypothetical protein